MTLVDRIAGQSFPRENVPAGCPLCAEVHEPETFLGGYGMTVSVAECRRDRLAYQTPRPSIEASRAYLDMRWEAEDRYVADLATQAARAARQLEQLPQDHEGGRLLDFGAGIGTFAAAAQAAGWEVEGVELNETATRRARDAFGLELLPEPTEGPFDVITMWDAVEHLRTPETVIRQLAARLAPAGLMLIETGNWECWQRVALGREWGLYLFDHQTYFSPASLAKLVARAGMPRFTLADSGHRKPSAHSWVRPLSAARKRRAYRRAAKWGPHGDIEVMFCTAARHG